MAKDTRQTVHDLCDLPQSRAALRIAFGSGIKRSPTDELLSQIHENLRRARWADVVYLGRAEANGKSWDTGSVYVTCIQSGDSTRFNFLLRDEDYIQPFHSLAKAAAKLLPPDSLSIQVYFCDDYCIPELESCGYTIQCHSHDMSQGMTDILRVPSDWYSTCSEWHQARWWDMQPTRLPGEEGKFLKESSTPPMAVLRETWV